MNSNPSVDLTAPYEACKLITCIVPNDGTGKDLIRTLRDEKQIIRVNSTKCLNIASVTDARTKFGELPEPTMMRKIDIVVPRDDADELYDYIYEKAHIGRLHGGVILMTALALTSPFSLPENLPLETP